MKRARIALVAAFAALLPMLMAPSGGFPSRPTFQQVTATDAAANQFFASSNSNTSVAGFKSTNSSAGVAASTIWRQQNNGVHGIDLFTTSSAFTGAFVTNGPTGESAGLRTFNAAVPIVFAVNGIARAQVTATGESMRTIGNSTGATNVSYLGFFDNAGALMGYVGDDSSGNAQVTLACQTSPCDVQLSPNGAGLATVNGVSITPAVTSATGTFTGLTTSPTTTVRFSKIGNSITMMMDAGGGTSNSNTFSLTGAIPAAMQATRQQSCPYSVTNNGVVEFGSAIIPAAGSTITFGRTTGTGAWTGSGAKAVDQMTCSYIAN